MVITDQRAVWHALLIVLLWSVTNQLVAAQLALMATMAHNVIQYAP